jgi:hypothetical protein
VVNCRPCTLKVRVENGRYIIDEKAELPDGTELYLVPLSEEEEDRLDAEAADRALAQAKASGEKPIPWAEVKAELDLHT